MTMMAVQQETASAHAGNGAGLARGAADGLCLAAAPTFAAMALLTAAFGGGPSDALCAAGHEALSGMVPMYLLMSAFHAASWLKLLARRRSGLGRRGSRCIQH
jgi:hypothetical protein